MAKPKPKLALGVEKSPTPEWREFEQLVARIEGILAPKGAVIKSPDRIKDRVTGELREVDASIRYQMEGTPILITVECRKRNRAQDDMWIEQLATKKDKVGAVKPIAVTAKGISQPAMKTARFYGIDVRKLSEITTEEIASWCELTSIRYEPVGLNIKEIHFIDVEGREISHEEIDDSIHKLIAQQKHLAPILNFPNGVASPCDLVSTWQREHFGTLHDLGYGVELDADPVKKGITFPVDPNGHWILTKHGERPVAGVGLLVEVKRRRQLIPNNGTYRYASPEKRIVDAIEFTIPEYDPVSKQPLRIMLHKGPESGIKATLTLEGPPK